jgi:phosphoserine phosphatase
MPCVSPARLPLTAAMSALPPYVLTLIADPERTPLTPSLLARVREASGGEAPVILSPGEAADIPLPEPPAPAALRAALEGAPVDAIAQPAEGRRKRLLIADMDSTIVTGETLDELADFAGLKAEIAAITRRSMNGELDFAAALRERVGMLRGLKLEALEATWARVRLTPGARELVATMRAHGAVTALVSGGFTFFTSRVAALVGFDLHRSNVLEHDGTALTGTVAEPILDRDAKLATLRALRAEHGLAPEETLAVGDGANDLAMLREAGLGVAYRAKPVVAAEARARVEHTSLRALLFAQGYRSDEIVPGAD